MFVGSWLHVSVYGWTQSGQQSPWAETPGHPGWVANAWALTLSIHSVCFPTNSQLEMGGFRENPSRLVWMKCLLSPFLCTWSIKFLLPDSYQFLGRWPYVGAIRDLRGPSNHIQTEISTHVFDSPTDYATCFFSRGWREWKWADSTWSKRRLLTHSCHPFVSSLIDPSITDILFFMKPLDTLHSDRPHSRQWDPRVNRSWPHLCSPSSHHMGSVLTFHGPAPGCLHLQCPLPKLFFPQLFLELMPPLFIWPSAHKSPFQTGLPSSHYVKENLPCPPPCIYFLYNQCEIIQFFYSFVFFPVGSPDWYTD